MWFRFAVYRWPDRGAIEIALGPAWITVYSWRRIVIHWKWTVV